MLPLRQTAFVLTGLLAAVGCTPIPTNAPLHGKPLLKPIQLPPESVALEIFFIRCPADDPRLNKDLWSDVDETPFPAESRRLWTQNGFRVGIVAGPLPDALAQLLEMKDQTPPDKSAEQHQPAAGKSAVADPPDKSEKPGTTVDLLQEPRVMVRHLTLRPGQRSEIVASGVYDEWTVLTCESGDVSGQTYNQAQGIFGMKIAHERDGRVRLELVPELFYGQMRQRWVGDQGIMRLEAGRPKRSFDKMTVPATLGLGQVLTISCLPNRPGSVGSYFFSDKQSGQAEQKLLLVRLMQTQHDDILPAPDALPLDNTR